VTNRIVQRGSARVIRDDLMSMKNAVEGGTDLPLLASGADYANVASTINNFDHWGKVPLARRKYLAFLELENPSEGDTDSVLKSIDSARAVLQEFEGII
jgi:hypothetical protein